jgi:hypothetical protein
VRTPQSFRARAVITSGLAMHIGADELEKSDGLQLQTVASLSISKL